MRIFKKMRIFFKHWENTREKICFCADFKKQYFLCGFLKTWFFCADYFFFQKKLKNRFSKIIQKLYIPLVNPPVNFIFHSARKMGLGHNSVRNFSGSRRVVKNPCKSQIFTIIRAMETSARHSKISVYFSCTHNFVPNTCFMVLFSSQRVSFTVYATLAYWQKTDFSKNSEKTSLNISPVSGSQFCFNNHSVNPLSHKIWYFLILNFALV